MSPKKVILEFIETCRKLDMEKFFATMDESIHYQMGVKKPIHGRQAVRADVEALGPITQMDFEVLRIAADGNIVMTERIDRSVINGHTIILPAAGVFEVKNGKIAYWRDYFDGHIWHGQGGRQMA